MPISHYWWCYFWTHSRVQDVSNNEAIISAVEDMMDKTLFG